jgi:hypothetical protein
MNSLQLRISRHGLRTWGPLGIGLLLTAAAPAFPPAPHHMVYGAVRDEFGNPISSATAEVWLEAEGRTLVRTPVAPSVEPGVNYRLAIPLDSGATADLYKPSALRPTVPFRMRVRVGNVTYLPLEMTGAAQLLTRPGAASRVDLTLGVDSDGDGLPDAWERALIQMLGGNLGLGDIRPADDSDGDGLSNLDEYLAGTYAFDPEDGFLLAIVPGSADRAVLEFTAIRGRSYTIHASESMDQWTPVSFNLATDPPGTAGRANFRAADTRLIRARVAPAADSGPAYRFFKLEVR